MILSFKNKKGYIFSYFEWDVVDILGRPVENGTYMRVRDLWVHSSCNASDLIGKFISLLDKHESNKSIKWIYWERTMKDEHKRISKLLSRTVCLRRAKSIYVTGDV